MTDSELFRRYNNNPGADHDSAAAKALLEQRKLPRSLRDPDEAAKRYKASDDLEFAINMAITVGAPLLLTGEPGTGKTQVAYHLKWYFGVELFAYVVRSTSTAEDLRYDFDAVAYLRESQRKDAKVDRPRDDPAYLTKHALWQAFEHDEPCVLLIDEIDKAPRDFPNDLLLELDQHRFQHPFRPSEWIEASLDHPPIVIITSNAERRLPDAFLRRCIYHHIDLTESLLAEAVRARVGDFPKLDEGTIEAALDRVWEIRDHEYLDKPPGTAEVLVWLTLLSARNANLADVTEPALADLPAIAALIKDNNDRERLRSG